MSKFLLCICLILVCASCSNNKYPSDYVSSPSIALKDVLDVKTGSSYNYSSICDIDYSNSSKGYILARKKNVDYKVKLQIINDNNIYNYDVDTKDYVGYPLNMGDGNYVINILRNVNDNQYAIANTIELDVSLENETSPYLYPNKIVNYSKDDEITSLSIKLCKDNNTDLERIKTCYDYVLNNLEYDDDKAIKASQTYMIPDLKQILKDKKGICFDYASLLCAMLRIQKIPTRIVCGNTDYGYHAWIEVYLEGEGWVNPDIFVDSEVWSRMDPTFNDSKYDYDGDYQALYYY